MRAKCREFLRLLEGSILLVLIIYAGGLIILTLKIMIRIYF